MLEPYSSRWVETIPSYSDLHPTDSGKALGSWEVNHWPLDILAQYYVAHPVGFLISVTHRMLKVGDSKTEQLQNVKSSWFNSGEGHCLVLRCHLTRLKQCPNEAFEVLLLASVASFIFQCVVSGIETWVISTRWSSWRCLDIGHYLEDLLQWCPGFGMIDLKLSQPSFFRQGMVNYWRLPMISIGFDLTKFPW